MPPRIGILGGAEGGVDHRDIEKIINIGYPNLSIRAWANLFGLHRATVYKWLQPDNGIDPGARTEEWIKARADFFSGKKGTIDRILKR